MTPEELKSMFEAIASITDSMKKIGERCDAVADAVAELIRANAGVADFRFHDFRHDFGTKLLRDSGNLKLVQKAMNHRDIKSTLRYAHVLDEDVAAAVERLAESRKNPRSKVRKVS
jgi:integrase